MVKFIRKSIIKFTVFFFLLVFSARLVLGLDFPEPVGYVNDFADIFTVEFESLLEEDLSNFEKETTAEIAVVTVDSLQETTIEDFAVRLFEEWRIGKEKEDNGLLLLVAPSERQLRIEVGYGLEPVITDSRAGRIIREEIIPEFKKEDYQQGVANGVEEIKGYIHSGQPPSEVEEVVETAESHFPVVIILIIILIYLSGFWGRSKRVWPGGVVGLFLGLVAGLILGAWIWKVFLPIIFAFLGFFLDWLLSRNYKKLKTSGKSTGWWSSKGGFFSSSSSSGGGGFGGFGGGSSGGGGASGKW